MSKRVYWKKSKQADISDQKKFTPTMLCIVSALASFSPNNLIDDQNSTKRDSQRCDNPFYATNIYLKKFSIVGPNQEIDS